MREESKTFTNACILTVTVRTTGLQGGDSGHGGWAEVLLKDDGSTDMNAQVTRTHSDRAEEITVRVGGDVEIMVLADALEWAGRRLREMTS